MELEVFEKEGTAKGEDFVFVGTEWYRPDGLKKEGIDWSLRVNSKGELIELITHTEINYMARAFGLFNPTDCMKTLNKYERKIDNIITDQDFDEFLEDLKNPDIMLAEKDDDVIVFIFEPKIGIIKITYKKDTVEYSHYKDTEDITGQFYCLTDWDNNILATL